MGNPLSRLAPKTLVPTGEGFGGHVRLEQCDVAYALAGLGNGPAALLRACLGGDQGEANMRDLYLWAWQEAVRVSVDRRWNPPRKAELLRALSARAVDEIVYPQLLLCPHCHGSKAVQPNQYNPNGDCKPCGNTGRRNPTDDEMATAFGLTEAEWAEWLPRYAVIFARILEWQSSGMRHVRERLNDDGA